MTTLASGSSSSRVRLHVLDRRRYRAEESECQRADAPFFRDQTRAIVGHFFEIASQIGRLPSIMGREFFRAKVSHHAIPSFEEQAVFVHDVEQALGQLAEKDAEVVALVGLLHYTFDDVAKMLGRSRSRVWRRYTDSLDRLAEIFLETGILKENRPDRHVHFSGRKNPTAHLPPRKPVISVTADLYHIVGQSGAGQPSAAGLSPSGKRWGG